MCAGNGPLIQTVSAPFPVRHTDPQNNSAGITNLHVVGSRGSQIDSDMATPATGGSTPTDEYSQAGDSDVLQDQQADPSPAIVIGNSLWTTAETILGMIPDHEDPPKVLALTEVPENGPELQQNPDLFFDGQTISIPLLPPNFLAQSHM